MPYLVWYNSDTNISNLKKNWFAPLASIDHTAARAAARTVRTEQQQQVSHLSIVLVHAVHWCMLNVIFVLAIFYLTRCIRYVFKLYSLVTNSFSIYAFTCIRLLCNERNHKVTVSFYIPIKGAQRNVMIHIFPLYVVH